MEVINTKNSKQKKANAKMNNKKMLRYLAYIIIFLIIILIAYSIISAVMSYANIQEINHSTALILSSAPALISLNGNEYLIQFISYSNYTSVGTFAITKLPIFVNPSMLVKVPLDNFTDVNLSSKYADLRIDLKNISSSSVGLLLTPIPINLTETPTSLRISFINNTLGTAETATSKPTSTPSSNVPLVTNTPTTTKSSSNSTTTPSSSSGSSSTSSSQNNTAKLKLVKSILAKSVYYPIMLNYTTMYADEVNCTPAMYNKTYYNLWGISPSGGDTYANITSVVPYKLTLNITNSTPELYTATYVTYSRNSSFSGNAITIGIDLSTNSITSTSLEGAYYGMNATTLEGGYLKANRVGVCGALICSTSKGC